MRFCWVTGFCLLLLNCSQCRPVATSESENADSNHQVVLKQSQVTHAQIKILQLQKRPQNRKITLIGETVFAPEATAQVYAPTSGRITAIHVELGEHVQQGQLLALMYSPAIIDAETALVTADLNKQRAEQALMRQRFLFTAHAAAERELDNATLRFENAQAEWYRAQTTQKIFAAIQQTGTGKKKLKSGSTVLQAPVAGIVTARNLAVGRWVGGQYSGDSTTTPLFTLVNSNHLLVMAAIQDASTTYALTDSNLLSQLQINVRNHNHNQSTAQIIDIAPFIGTMAYGLQARLKLENQEKLGVVAGEQVWVDLIFPAQPMITAPRSCVFFTGHQQIVLLAQTERDNTAFSQHPVTTEEYNEDTVMFTSGVEAGDNIVCKGGIVLLDLTTW